MHHYITLDFLTTSVLWKCFMMKKITKEKIQPKTE